MRQTLVLLTLTFLMVGLRLPCASGQSQDGEARQTPVGVTSTQAAKAATNLGVQNTPVALLALRTLRDAGGAGIGLNIRLTGAFTRFLTDHAGGAFRMVPVMPPYVLPTGTRYTLEGDLSCTDGAGEDNARFLLVTRLYREGATRYERVLVGQWAGTSDSLRLLTTNLRHDPRFHTLGLVGEMGSRIAACITNDNGGQAAHWRALSSRLGQNGAGETAASIEIVTGMDMQMCRQVSPATPFRVRLQSRTPARAFVVVGGRMGAYTVARLDTNSDALIVQAGRTALSLPIVLPDDAQDVWIACTPMSRPADHVRHTQTTRRICRTGSDMTRVADSDDAPVRLLDGLGNAAVATDAALTRLLDDMTRDPAVWRVVRFRVAAHK